MTWQGWFQILIYVAVLTALTPLLGGYMARVYILRLQGALPFNPLRFGGAPWNVTFNTTSSFITNTNWQYYGGETTMSHLSQMAGLAGQNFVSAAVGMAVLAAVIRGFARGPSLVRPEEVPSGTGHEPGLLASHNERPPRGAYGGRSRLCRRTA